MSDFQNYIFYFSIAVIFCTPLIFCQAILDGYSLSKQVFFLGFFSLILGVCLIHSSIKRKISVANHPIFLWLGLFILVSFISTIKAVNIFDALFRQFELVVYFLMMQIISWDDSSKARNTAIQAMVISSALVGLYGISQALGYDFAPIQANFDPISTIGHRNFVGHILIIGFPLSLYCLFYAINKLTKLLFLLSSLIIFAHLILTQSRGAWTGFFFGGLIAVLFWLFHLPNKREIIKPLYKNPYFLIFSSAGIILVLISGIKYPIFDRARTIFDAKGGTNRFRLLVWKSTLPMVRDHLFFGVGPANFIYQYPIYRNPEEAKFSGLHIFVNNTHNDFLQFLSENGIIGFILILMVFFQIYRGSCQLLKAKIPQSPVPFILWAVSSTFVQAFFCSNFTDPASSPLFWACVAILISLSQKRKFLNFSPSAVLNQALFILGVFFILFPPYYLGKMALANYYLKKGKEYEVANIWDQAERMYKRSIDLFPHSYRAHYYLAYSYGMQKKYGKALEYTFNCLKYHPHYRNAIFNLGVIYENQSEYDKAIEAYKKALQIDPEFISAQNNLIVIYERQGKIDQAFEVARKALQFDPHSPDAHNNLGVLYFYKGDYEKALEEYKKVLSEKNTIRFDPADINQMSMFGLIKVRTAAFDLENKLIGSWSEWGSFMVRQNPEVSVIINNPPTGFRFIFDPRSKELIMVLDDVTDAYYYTIEYIVRNKTTSYNFSRNEIVFAKAQNNIGSVFEKQNKYDLAIDAYKKAIQMRPDYSLPYKNLAALYINTLKDYQNGLVYLKKYAELEKFSPQYAEIQAIIKQVEDTIEKGSDIGQGD